MLTYSRMFSTKSVKEYFYTIQSIFSWFLFLKGSYRSFFIPEKTSFIVSSWESKAGQSKKAISCRIKICPTAKNCHSKESEKGCFFVCEYTGGWQ